MNEKLKGFGRIDASIAVIGDKGAGKSNIIHSFSPDYKTNEYQETLGIDFVYYIMNYFNNKYGFKLWELTNYNKFKNVQQNFYKNANGVIVVYAKNTKNPLKNVKIWLERFFMINKNDSIPILIIENKIDKSGKSKLNNIARSIKELYPNTIIKVGKSTCTDKNATKELLLTYFRLIINFIDKNYIINAKIGLTDIFPFAALMIMNEITGPKIVSSYPSLKNFSENDKIIMQTKTIKLISTLDFDEIIENNIYTGSLLWSVPQGILHYVPFIMENNRARGSQELYLIGILLSHEYEWHANQILDLVIGFILRGINEVANYIKVNNIDVITTTGKLSKIHKIEISLILKKIIQRSYDSIIEWNDNVYSK